ncbi:signal peptidase I [Desulfallas sp. Bu1-1]|jgi:signal peptidase I|uniref:signal peptidase I n=1 Tax=Desulfallas sp. Bu1-1 TaxID=2787620 RepID=UPI00189F266A|nr:signal peptidase I [Desulfallas sp. Bu1-1]MBF7083599.1 signal peptidase I [Desulfallas sp. Bu1-1]
MDQLDQKLEQGKRKNKPAVVEILESVAIAVLLAVLIRMFVFQPFVIPSGSMEPTLQVGDRIMVSKFTYHFTEPKRGDIIVFKFPLDPSRNFVKRAIGTGGETVSIRNSRLYINGRQVPEDYLPAGLRFADYGPVEVPPGSYFMMGDNRNNSDDSRVWGMLPGENIVGKAVLIYWPLNRIRLL